MTHINDIYGDAAARNMNNADTARQAQPGLMIDAEAIVGAEFADDLATPLATVNVTSPIQLDRPGDLYERGNKVWGTENGNALAVFERGSKSFTAGQIVVGTANGGTSIVVGRQKGRKNVTISVPATYTASDGTSSTPNGVAIAETEGELQLINGGFQLNPGDSITISTEAPVWAGLLPGKSSGLCQYLVEYNPTGTDL
jgi:hypothetical protein